MTYMQLDYALVHEIPLFTLEPDFDFEFLEKRIDEILGALPSIKRIFAQPFIHLKEQDVILPVEAVRIIDNNTIKHASSHSELWTDVKESEVKPSKLLTRTYEDNYGIYENLVFCKTVDDILAFSRTNLRFLKELIYTNRTIEINLLERLNHLSYFLALGKLHTGYVRNFDEYYGISKRCLNKLQYITNTVIPRLKRPVYKNNKVRPAQIKLRKTNILSMHKEYHRVYKLAKSFADNNAAVDENLIAVDQLSDTYFYFCELLCIFAIGHFNFECDENKTIDFARLNMDFRFKGWSLKLKKAKCGNVPLISVAVKKEKAYVSVFIPSLKEDNEDLIRTVKNVIQADEYILCTPYENSSEKRILWDISSLESFRRVQQAVLRAMVYADEKRDECPFCKNKLVLSEASNTNGSPVYECLSCRTEIGEKYCSETQKSFPYTKIANYSKQTSAIVEEDWMEQRKTEAQMYFRNITELNGDMETICPHCGKAHK